MLRNEIRFNGNTHSTGQLGPAINEMFWPKNALVHMANNCTFSRRNDILSLSLDILRRPQNFEKNLPLCFDVTKGGLISEGILSFVPLPTKRCKIANFVGNQSQSLSFDIKTPLSNFKAK